MRHFQVHVTYKVEGYRSQTLIGFIQNDEPTEDEIKKAVKEQQGDNKFTFFSYTIKTLS